MKRQKNDAADAEAIAIAARQPEMRFVEPKTQDQQARAVLLRGRAVLYEFGRIVPQGIVHIKRLDAIIADEKMDLPDIVREECRNLLAQIDEKTIRIEAKTAQLADLSRSSGAARTLARLPT